MPSRAPRAAAAQCERLLKERDVLRDELDAAQGEGARYNERAHYYQEWAARARGRVIAVRRSNAQRVKVEMTRPQP